MTFICDSKFMPKMSLSDLGPKPFLIDWKAFDSLTLKIEAKNVNDFC